jgi:uncharacterized protein with FMN-binding domain
MRVPHFKTLVSHLGTVGAMAGLIAAKTAAHKAPSRAPLVTKTVRGAGTAAVMSVTGPPVPIAHGVVRVRITVSAGHITDVTVASLPHDNDISWMRSEMAARLLAGEAVTAQSAHIDAVSGATYTSKAYVESLQAAIDAAGLGK